MRWCLASRPLPDQTVDTASADALIPGLFSTDESVAMFRRFQPNIARSSHGLCSPPRYDRPPTATSSRWGRTEHQRAGVDRSGPLDAAVNRGGAGLRPSLRWLPCVAMAHGQCSSLQNARGRFPQQRLFSVERGPCARPRVPTAEAATNARAGPPESVRLSSAWIAFP